MTVIPSNQQAPTIERLRTLLRAATERPWAIAESEYSEQGYQTFQVHGLGSSRYLGKFGTDGREEDASNADLAVAAVNELENLLDTLEYLGQERDNLTEELADERMRASFARERLDAQAEGWEEAT